MVPQCLTKERIKGGYHSAGATLQQDFGIEKPKIAVMGLNPHAGEGGLLGSEEVEQIAPAVKECWEQGVPLLWPFSCRWLLGQWYLPQV